jgi:ketosteroid isomerase-like protein
MSAENLKRLRDVYDAWGRGNFEAGADLFAADVVFEPLVDGRSVYVGLKETAAYMREFLAQWDRYRVEAREMVEAEGVVVVTEHQYGVGKSSGVETEMVFYAVWTFRDGAVVRLRWESDRITALNVAGLQD